jgi:xanthine phosphoribosyltransferase
VEQLLARLREDGRHLGGGMIRVSDFLNHQVDAPLLAACGAALAEYWRDTGVTRVLTAETSGIPPALTTAVALQVPLVYARKKRIGTLGHNVLSAESPSPTHGGSNDLVVSRPLLGPGERVLIVDDFLASGSTIVALAAIIAQGGATLVGVAALIEKCYAGGRARIAHLGVPVLALAAIRAATEAGLDVADGRE